MSISTMSEVVADSNVGAASNPTRLLHALELRGIPLKPTTQEIIRASQSVFTNEPHFPKRAKCRIGGKEYTLEYDARHANTKERNYNMAVLANLKLIDSEEEYEIIHLPETRVVLDKAEIALRSFVFSRIGDSVPISAITLTRGSSSSEKQYEFQGLGIGTGLTLLSNILIRDVVEKFDLGIASNIYARITDVASGIVGSGVKREGWSSNVAALLEYKNIDTGDGLKTFRYDFKRN